MRESTLRSFNKSQQTCFLGDVSVYVNGGWVHLLTCQPQPSSTPEAVAKHMQRSALAQNEGNTPYERRETSTETHTMSSPKMEDLEENIHVTELQADADTSATPQDADVPGEMAEEKPESAEGDGEEAAAPVADVKDFAYSISDPRHFGIFDDESSDEDEDTEEEESEIGQDEGGVGAEEKEYGENTHGGYRNNTAVDGWGNVSIEYGGVGGYASHGREYPDEAATGLYEPVDNPETTDTYCTIEHSENEIAHAIALYPFVPENSNELSLVPDQLLIINYECGDGWLVAHDPESGKTGLVPSEYIRMLDSCQVEDDYDTAEYNEFAEDAKDAQRFMPEILGGNSPDPVPTERFNNLAL